MLDLKPPSRDTPITGLFRGNCISIGMLCFHSPGHKYHSALSCHLHFLPRQPANGWSGVVSSLSGVNTAYVCLCSGSLGIPRSVHSNQVFGAGRGCLCMVSIDGGATLFIVLYVCLGTKLMRVRVCFCLTQTVRNVVHLAFVPLNS